MGTTRRLKVDKRALFRLLGYEPHPGQLAVHLSKAPRRILGAGCKWGKSTCVAMEAVAAAMSPSESSLGWIVTPSFALTDLLFQQMRATVEQRLAHRVLRIERRERVIVLRNLLGGVSEIRGRSAEKPSNLLGAGLDWLIVDDAAALREDVWPSYLSGRLVDRKGWALLVSTPRGHGWYHDLFERGQDDRDPEFESWQQPSWTNPLLDPATIELERGRVSADVFAEEWAGQFVGPDGSPCRACGWPEQRAGEITLTVGDAMPEECGGCGRLLSDEGLPIGWPEEVEVIDLFGDYPKDEGLGCGKPSQR